MNRLVATTKREKANRKKLTRGTTAVRDRVAGLPLGHEAQMLAELLRGCGANPELVPDHDVVAWMAARGRDAKRVPMWMLDLVVAILEQIPRRPRKPGRAKQDAVKRVEVFAHGMPIADAARMVAVLEARQRDKMPEAEIKKRADNLAHQVYRHRKPGMP
jgi:hypothetical protein